jgi:hypothetical protein
LFKAQASNHFSQLGSPESAFQRFGLFKSESSDINAFSSWILSSFIGSDCVGAGIDAHLSQSGNQLSLAEAAAGGVVSLNVSAGAGVLSSSTC